MKKVISVSRRSDIPACYLPWLIGCLEKGYVLVKNPYSGIIRHINMQPDVVHTLVLWSKNYTNFLEQKEAFQQLSAWRGLLPQHARHLGGLEWASGIAAHVSRCEGVHH